MNKFFFFSFIIIIVDLIISFLSTMCLYQVFLHMIEFNDSNVVFDHIHIPYALITTFIYQTLTNYLLKYDKFAVEGSTFQKTKISLTQANRIKCCDEKMC